MADTDEQNLEEVEQEEDDDDDEQEVRMRNRSRRVLPHSLSHLDCYKSMEDLHVSCFLCDLN